MKRNRSTLRSLSAIALTAISLSAYASYNVSGAVVDADGEGCPNAMYHIYVASDTIHPIANAVTDMDGHFTHRLNSAGSYLLQAEYVGLTPEWVSFTLSSMDSEIELGNIVLRPSDTELSEVVVTGRRPMIITDGANLEYNVKEDPTYTTSSILEMLRKVPMVTVDGEDNIRVNGSTDFKIYLNGKPNPMFDSDPQRVLKATPAAAISRIEVLTEPGAKYDAEGTGGILNLVIEAGGQQQVADGYAGTLGAQVAVENTALNGYVRGKYRNVSGSASLLYAHGPVITRSAESHSEIEYLDSETDRKMVREMNQPKANPFDLWQGNLAFTWEPNEKNILSVTASLTNVTGRQDMFGTTSMFDAAGGTRWSQRSEVLTHVDKLDLTADASYQHLFRGQDHTLTASFQYSHGNMNVDASTLEAEVWTDNALDTKTNEYTLQVDWHNRLDDHNTVEAGAKGVLTDNRNNSYTEVDGVAQSDLISLKQYRNLGAVYGSYTGTFGHLSATAGVRYEYSNLGIDFLTAGRDDFDSYLNDVVPNASISWSFNQMTTLRAAYNMRISRPDITQLNPFRYSLVYNEVQCGNPDLSSQHSNNVSLSFSSFAGKVQYSLRAEYQNINNLITSYMYTDGETLVNTYRNAGTQQKGILSANANWFITPQAMLSLNGAVEYTDFSLANAGNHGWSGNAGGNFSWTLPCRLTLSAYGGWSSRTPTIQGSRSGWHYYGVGISRSFLKDDALKLSLSASNMFTKWTSWSSTNREGNVISTSEYRRQNWNASIGIQWNFGHLRQNVRTVENRIDNNDKATTGSSNGGAIL